MTIPPPSKVFKLPRPPSGWFDLHFSVLLDGSLAILRSRVDYHALHAIWLARVRSGDTAAPRPGLGAAPIMISHFDGAAEGAAIVVSGCIWPRVSRFADERWLVVAPRAAPGEPNARVFTSDGLQIGAFHLGDGIGQVSCAADGSIWVGYFDEGVFGFADGESVYPVSSGGIVQFGSEGLPRFSFNDHTHKALTISDYYAMTVSGDAVWSCSYAEFDIAEVRSGTLRFWKNDVVGAKAVAVNDDYVLLGGGYGDDTARLALLRLKDNHAGLVGAERVLPVPSHRPYMLQGNGAAIHCVAEGRWVQWSVNDVKQHFGL